MKNNIQIGDCERSGYTANNKTKGCLPDSCVNHSTVYKEQFYNKNNAPASNPFGVGEVGQPMGDGYTKNEGVHGWGSQEERIKGELHPYVVRSMRARDPFYGERESGHRDKMIALKS